MVLSILAVGLFLCRLPSCPVWGSQGRHDPRSVVFVYAGGVVAGPVIVVVEAIIGFGLSLFRGWASFVHYCGKGFVFFSWARLGVVFNGVAVYVQLSAFLARPVKHRLNAAVSITDKSVLRVASACCRYVTS
jgi:hypothetical protein